MPNAVAFAIFGKDSNRLFFSISDKFAKNVYEIEIFLHCSLDIVDDKLGKSNELYLGHLYNDQKFKSFGYVTNTGIRMVLVLELGNMTLKDQEVRAIFKRFHLHYANAVSNPFHRIGDELQSKCLREATSQLFAD